MQTDIFADNNADLAELGLKSRVLQLRAHPAADIFPLMSEPEIWELGADIKAKGLRDPIVLHPDGSILDGRNRYRACLHARVTPTLERWTGAAGAELEFVISKNLQRRHLTESQRAIVAARIKEYRSPEALARKGKRTDLRADLRESDFGKTSEKVADELNVSARSVDSAARVLREGVPELVNAVETGTTSVHAAADIARLPKEEQTEIVARGEDEILRVAKELRKKKTREALHSSESNEHFTPAYIVEPARELLGDIDLDPASCVAANKVIRAKKFYDETRDGLSVHWFGRVFLNCPYGHNEANESNQGVWTSYLLEQYEARHTTAAFLVVNGVPDRKWFKPLWRFPICFPDDRIPFLDPETLEPQKSPTNGNALVYLGEDFKAFERLFSPIGQIVLPSKKHSLALVEVAAGRRSVKHPVLCPCFVCTTARGELRD
jgi:ParB family transcriptional regulator, chromosome partitioning protein